MNAPRPDRVAAIATELGLLGRRLDALAEELSTWQGGPTPGPTAGPPWPTAGGPQPPAPPPFPPGPPVYAPLPSGPFPSAPFPSAPMPPPAPRRSLRVWLASLSGARLLAWTGAGVTLLGVVLLLALAASRGWFAPPVRVAGGAVLGLALVGLGCGCTAADARTGALAMAGTGFATLYLVVAAATALYGYLRRLRRCCWRCWSRAGGLGLADRWRAQLLGAAPSWWGGGAGAGARPADCRCWLRSCWRCSSRRCR